MHSKMNENTRGFRDVYVQALQIELGLLSHSILVFLLDISTSYICYAFVAVDYSAALAKLCDQIEPPDRTSEREYVSGRIRL